MSARHDVVVVGGGHNGLVAATLLARAGLEVVVLERAEGVGGTLATDEIHAGFRAPATFAGLERLHPAVEAELELARHGLSWIEPRGGTTQLTAPGESLHLDPSQGLQAALAPSAPRDAAALAGLETTRRELAAALEPLWTAPLPRTGGSPREGLADLRLLFRSWRGLERAGSVEALRLLPMSVRDVLDERLESEPLKAALALPALQASMLAPRSAGSFLNLLWHRPGWVGHLLAPPRQAAGGPGALAAALEAAARAAGVAIRTGAEVERIAVAGGAARAAVLAGGEEVSAERVVSALDPHRTLGRLLEPGALDAETAAELEAVRCRGNVAIVRLALDRVPRLGTGDAAALAGRFQTCASLDELEQAYDACKYGGLAESPALEITVPSAADPSLAPGGGAVVHVWVHFTPPLRRTGLPAARERRSAAPGAADPEPALAAEIERRVLETLDRHDPGLRSSVLAASVLTAAALEARFGVTAGCLHHVEPALDQSLWLRPLHGWHQHATPIPGLYLAGPGTHPGGGPTGLPGRNAALRLLRDAGRRRSGAGAAVRK